MPGESEVKQMSGVRKHPVPTREGCGSFWNSDHLGAEVLWDFEILVVWFSVARNEGGQILQSAERVQTCRVYVIEMATCAHGYMTTGLNSREVLTP